MKIMIFDVPAESGGALSVLADFYERYKNDKENEYFFIVSTPRFEETSNVKIFNFPWIKRSWFHRLFFDNFVAPKLIKEHKIDEILSLQNTIIPKTKKYQTVYVHNALPFSEYKFKFRENRILWIYQNIISEFIFKSIKKADHVIVQTKWMKNECVKKLGVEGSKVEVSPPKIQLNVIKSFNGKFDREVTFFYPASSVYFKNHKLIVEACNKLKKSCNFPYKVLFTLKGNENKHIAELYRTVKEDDLPIEFIGNLTREKVFEYYSTTILLFPSFIESSPLPLSEARLHNTLILASNYAFSHEVLDGYNKVDFFNAFDIEDLGNKMEKFIQEYS